MRVGALVYLPDHKIYGIIVEVNRHYPYIGPSVLWVRSHWFGGNSLTLGPTRWFQSERLNLVGETETLPRP